MKFSILVPVYNVEKYLEQCVESLLNQTYNGEYEIILVDDGSTDSSGKICDNYAKNHPQKITVIHKENQGLVSARQAGISNAGGEFCIFVDSDDFVEKNLLETVSICLDRNSNTDTVIYSFYYYADGKKSRRNSSLAKSETVFIGKEKEQIYESLIFTTFTTAIWIKAVKTEILRNDPTDYSLYYDKNMAEDWFRSIHLLTAAEKIVYINEPLYNYRINNESISHSFRPETIKNKNILYVYDRFIEYLPKWELYDDFHIQKLNARWFNDTIYTFSKYYENAHTPNERKIVVDFNWGSFLPVGAKDDTGNPFESRAFRKLYSWIINKKYLRIRFFFFKNKLYKRIRNLKARLLFK